MLLEFSNAKDGLKTFSADGVFFHSTYSPYKEAERFIESLQFINNPKYIFLVEPGLSYTHEILKKKYSECKTICIRLFDSKLGDENIWDYVIYFSEIQNLNSYLTTHFDEEKLLNSTIAFTQQAQKFFCDKITLIIEQYKQALETAKTLLVTRQFFEKKWLINSCNFVRFANRVCNPQLKTTLPVVVCASGPGLESCLNILYENQNKLFIIGLSSATKVLLQNNIIPDLIISTDGGWWAGEHLKELKKHNDIILASPCEAFIPKSILKNNILLALKYNDSSSFISSNILESLNVIGCNAVRNPTVSGTAFYFAKEITNNKIFFCGLDLAGGKGHQHTKPNEIEKDNLIFDNRIKNVETRNSRSRYNTQSLEIYREWFSSLDDVENVYRVIDNKAYVKAQKSLGKIKDISAIDFDRQIKDHLTSHKEKKAFELNECQILQANREKTFELILKNLQDEKWAKQIFPADYLSINNSSDAANKEQLKNRLGQKIKKLEEKIRTIAYEG